MYLAQSTNWGHFPGSRSNWKLEVLAFDKRGKPESGEKPLGARTRTNIKHNEPVWQL